MLDPKDDVSAFLDEFGVDVIWSSNSEDIDAQTGSPIEVLKTKRIKVVLTERKRNELIFDMGKIDEEVLSMFCKAEDNIQVNDKITVAGIDYVVTRLISQPIFTDKSSEISFSTAGRQWEISRVVEDA